MKTTEHIANTASMPKTGLFATLSAFPHLEGTGARSTGPVKLVKLALFSLPALVLASLAFTAAPALAAGPEAPKTEPVVGVTATAATFEGVVSPEATVFPVEAGTYEFLYKESETSCEGGAHAPAAPEMYFGGEPERVAQAVTGLKAGTTYTVCLRAETVGGETVGAPVMFTTVPAPKTEAVTLIGATTATFNGKLTPLNATVPTEYFFYYNFREEPACTVEQATGAASPIAEAVSTPVSGLEPGEKYTVCLAVYNALGAFEVDPASPPIHFETKPAPPEVVAETESAGPVTPDEETLNAQVNANNQETTYAFEYSLKAKGETLEGTVTTLDGADAIPKEPFGVQLATVPVPGLVQNTTYYYRVTAENTAGEKAKAGKVEHFTTLLETPETLPATLLTSSAATLNGVLSPSATLVGEAGTYEFLYRQSPSECQGEGGKAAPAPARVALGGKEAVSVGLTGLPPDTTYTYCLLERSAANATAIGTAVTFTTRGAGISEEYVSEVDASTAILHAKIDPNESNTTYHFEYDTSPYASSTPHGTSLPVPSGEIPAGTSPVPVTVQLQGLQPPGTTYYYRVVAVSELAPGELATFDGPDKTLTTNAASSSTAEACPNAQARTEQPFGSTLPDCRAYEMVSPLDKTDSNISFADSRASVSGEAFAYKSRGSFSGPRGAAILSEYISRREPAKDRWSAQNISPPVIITSTLPATSPFEELLFTPSLSQGLVDSPLVPLVEGEPAGYWNLYVADLTSTPVSYQTVSNVRPPGTGPYTEGATSAELPRAAGTSTDLSHVVFQSAANLTPNTKGSHEHVYEWAANKLNQVDVPPAGTEFNFGDNVGAPGNNTLQEFEDGDIWHAVSANGLRVFFTAGEQLPGQEMSAGQVYVRENPEQPQSQEADGECVEPAKACTVEVSKSHKTNGTGPEATQPAYFRDANAEGTRVFFTSRAELTNNANTGPDDNTANLYEYELSSEPGKPGKLTDLTAPTKVEDPNGAAVLGLVTAGENAGEENSYVYFVANGVLASNENASKETAQPGTCKQEEQESLTGVPTCNLYVAHDNGGKWEEPKFIAMLAGGLTAQTTELHDEQDWQGYEDGELGSDHGPVSHTARVTPDGTTLAFESERSLTGYDNAPAAPDDCGTGFVIDDNFRTGPCREVYLYDAITGSISCVSCDSSGVRPAGPAELGGRTEAEQGVIYSQVYLPSNLSEDGGRLFFQSLDPLVPHDSDGKLNVYEWEAEGEGSCRRTKGCIYSISDVAGDYSSHFMDADTTGENVFIDTSDRLVPSDTDTNEDVYDVRVGGGFPVPTPLPVCDNGDSCKSPVSPQPPSFGSGPTETFSGSGNPPRVVVAPPPKKTTKKTVKCRRGFVRNKRDRCSRKKKSKKTTKSARGRK